MGGVASAWLIHVANPYTHQATEMIRTWNRTLKDSFISHMHCFDNTLNLWPFSTSEKNLYVREKKKAKKEEKEEAEAGENALGAKPAVRKRRTNGGERI